MNKYNFIIGYSRLMSIPYINNVFYKIQIFLLENGMIKNILVSSKQNKYKDKIIVYLNKNFKPIVCRSYKLQSFLQKIKSEIVLDFEVKNMIKLPSDHLYQIMWSLVYANSVTNRTKKSLKQLIPNNFPIRKTIVIPYNDSFEVVCDYIFQTAKVLSNKGNNVYLLAMTDTKSIFKPFSKKEIKNISRKDFFDKNNINVVYPMSIFPIRLNKYKIIFDINKYISRLYTKYYISYLKTDYLWCFDPSDISIVNMVKGRVNTIYDCVDYFSSLDKNIDKNIKLNEVKLIKSVDHFFVNSSALAKTKGKIRKPDAVVVQGFDLKSLSEVHTPEPNEVIELKKISKIFARIPKPIVGFVGTLTYRFDFKLLFELIKNMPNISFVFTDAFLPFPNDDMFVGTTKLLEQIRAMKNVYFIPRTGYRSVIKALLKKFDIGMIPYDIDFDFNRYCYPMKLFEYFYVGLPVISTPILELERFPGLVEIGKNSKEWEIRIKRLLIKKWPNKNKIAQMDASVQNSWENKVNKIISKL